MTHAGILGIWWRSTLQLCRLTFVISLTGWSFSCTKAARQVHDAGTQMPADAGARDAAVAVKCSTAAPCTLIGRGCCFTCVPKKTDVLAVLTSERDVARERECPSPQPSCGPCAPVVYDPLRPVLRAACVAERCVVVDLREEPTSTCQKDGDCKLVEQGCCGSCGPDPSGWIALSQADHDPYAATCDPLPPCAPCSDSHLPEAFCATDGHCAVREVPRVKGVASQTCFSPTRNLDLANQSGATGCDCYVPGTSLCLRDSSGRFVTLHCGQDSWFATLDSGCGH